MYSKVYLKQMYLQINSNDFFYLNYSIAIFMQIEIVHDSLINLTQESHF